MHRKESCCTACWKWVFLLLYGPEFSQSPAAQIPSTRYGQTTCNYSETHPELLQINGTTFKTDRTAGNDGTASHVRLSCWFSCCTVLFLLFSLAAIPLLFQTLKVYFPSLLLKAHGLKHQTLALVPLAETRLFQLSSLHSTRENECHNHVLTLPLPFCSIL